MTETPVGQIKVDTTPPTIDLTKRLDLGDVFEYNLQDNESGLAIVRVVIEDEDERFPKVVWLENLSGNTFGDEFIWDGKWKDKSTAITGEYPIFIKATDQAGNEAIDYGIVKINPLSYFQSIPEFIPPVSEEMSNESTSQLNNEETTEQSFGGNSTPTQPSETQTLISLTGTATAGASTNTPTSNILWGAGAMAVIGAATAYALEQQRQREEEEEQSYQQVQQQAEMLNQQEQQRIANQWLEGQAILNAYIEQLESQGATPEQIAELREQGATQGFGTAHQNAGYLSLSLAQQAALAQQAQQSTHNHLMNEHQDQQDSYISPSEAAQNSTYNHLLNEHQDQQSVYTPVTQNESWQESAWNWAYNNQTELSFGTGLTIGAIAAIGIIAGVITAPAWIVIGGVALLTAGLIAGGTLLINNHFGLDPSTNLVDNLITGVVPALALTGVGYLIAITAPMVTTNLITACAYYQSACAQVGNVIDHGEEILLVSQMAYYRWIGDDENVAETAIELQFENTDGNVPGNTAFVELTDLFASYGDEAVSIVMSRDVFYHIIERHTIKGSNNSGSSVFFNKKDIPSLLTAAEDVAPVPQSSSTFERIIDAKRIIGIDSTTGEPTSIYTVITDQSGNLITMFPGEP